MAVPPPRYSTIAYTTTPVAPAEPKQSRIAAFFTRRRRSSSPSPPPYVDAEELAMIEERLKQLDTFFGGAAL